MGEIADEESHERVRAILMAGDFDEKTHAVARMDFPLSLRSCRVDFETVDDAGGPR